MGKDWSKGLTAGGLRAYSEASAGTDDSAAPAEPASRSGTRTLPLEWSPVMAYVVGLMASDGCLLRDGRHLAFDSNDLQLIETFSRCLGRRLVFRTTFTRAGNRSYQTAFSDAALHRWLRSVGLIPRKSLTLGPLAVPRDVIIHVARGLFDGDGHLANFVHAPTLRTYPRYVHERLWLYFNSASRRHVDWIRSELRETLGVDGYVGTRPARPPRHAFYRLQYGKRASIRLLTAFYEDPSAPRLERKWAVWEDYRLRHLAD